jgi:hypothetical protein
MSHARPIPAPSFAAHAQALLHLGRRAAALIGARPAPDLKKELAPLGPVALVQMFEGFGLPPLARDVFALIAAPECGTEAAASLAGHPLSLRARATPALIEAVLGPEAVPLVTHTGLLRAAGLVTLESGSGFAQRMLALPEAVVAALRGVPEPDLLLQPAVSFVATQSAEPESTLVAEALLRGRDLRPSPLLHLHGQDSLRASRIAAWAFGELGLATLCLDPALLGPGCDPARVADLLNRDLILLGAGVLLPATQDGAQIAERTRAAVLIHGAHPGPMLRPVATVEMAPPTRPHGLPVRLTASDLADVQSAQALGLAPDIWTLARARAARGLEDLAERIEPQAVWQDLVLPPAQMAQLHGLSAAKRHGPKVLDDWGFRAKSERGTGLAALFAGPSGTGKTMAAEILARDLGPSTDPAGGRMPLALYRVDLSAMVSKWIGETQKNIARLFDAAEDAGAVLLFDEGEALFSRRAADPRDSNDRHGNADTAYLLQRLESYTGVAIVTTNMRQAVDEAFLRRFRAVVEFPFPDQAQRAAIWARIFPAQVPLQDVDFNALSRLAISGGFIRSMALSAAYMAAEAGGPVTMALLERAARMEYSKLGKPLAEAELRGFR